jgi:hypothetical protein
LCFQGNRTVQLAGAIACEHQSARRLLLAEFQLVADGLTIQQSSGRRGGGICSASDEEERRPRPIRPRLLHGHCKHMSACDHLAAVVTLRLPERAEPGRVRLLLGAANVGMSGGGGR